MVGLVFAAKLDVVAVESQNNASCMRGDVMVCGACSMPEECVVKGGWTDGALRAGWCGSQERSDNAQAASSVSVWRAMYCFFHSRETLQWPLESQIHKCAHMS